jgi:hypothetical protein
MSAANRTKATGDKPAAFGKHNQPACNAIPADRYAQPAALARILADPFASGARPHVLIAWEAGDAQTTRDVAASLPDQRTREIVRSMAGTPIRYCIVWGRLWNAKVGALHVGAHDDDSLLAALTLVMAKAEECRATTTAAYLILPAELRDRCAAHLGELVSVGGNA